MSKFKLIQTYRESDNLVDWLQRFVGTVAEVENWREIGDTNNPAFENSWVDYDSANYETPAFYKDPFNRVHLKGNVKNGVSSTIFTLPVGYRPLSLASQFRHIDITSGGLVRNTSGSTIWVELDGVSFRV